VTACTEPVAAAQPAAAAVESAAFVRHDLADAAARAASHARLYLGSETCEALLPDARTVKRLLRLVDGRPISVTLVTPPCTDRGLARVEKMLRAAAPGTEVVCNDWGVLERLGESPFRPVFGRLLLRIPRGFCRAGLDHVSPEMLAFLRHSSLDNAEFQAFLTERGVSRVELDNVAQGYSFRPGPTLRASLYHPYVYIASGRRCLHARLGGRGDAYRTGRACGKACGDVVVVGKIGAAHERVLLSESAHFYWNALPGGTLPAEARRWGVDRLVDCSILSPGPAALLAKP
jgi:hypothetical protein